MKRMFGAVMITLVAGGCGPSVPRLVLNEYREHYDDGSKFVIEGTVYNPNGRTADDVTISAVHYSEDGERFDSEDAVVNSIIIEIKDGVAEVSGKEATSDDIPSQQSRTFVVTFDPEVPAEKLLLVAYGLTHLEVKSNGSRVHLEVPDSAIARRLKN